MFVKTKGTILFIIFFLLSASFLCAADYDIVVDCNDGEGTLNKFWLESVGSTHMGMVNYSNYHEQDSPIPLNLRNAYKIAANELGFKRVRGHGILNDDVGIYSEDGNGYPVYTWDKFDELMDFIVNECGMSPVVELSYMPSALANNSGDTLFWYGACKGIPKDWDKWQDLIYEVVKHSIERYGASEVEKWYWEIWNEPNLDGFWSGTQAEYFKLYDYAVE
ncbi:MAG: glycoside hydrolase, partial [Spirochaetes bacterium]|nr:glycoside hydrolase [Spirochaetota bacterium]